MLREGRGIKSLQLDVVRGERMVCFQLCCSDQPGRRPRLSSAIFRTSSIRPKFCKIWANPRLTIILLNSAESPVSTSSAEQYKANIYLVIDLQLSNYYKTEVEVDKQPCIRWKLMLHLTRHIM